MVPLKSGDVLEIPLTSDNLLIKGISEDIQRILRKLGISSDKDSSLKCMSELFQEQADELREARAEITSLNIVLNYAQEELRILRKAEYDRAINASRSKRSPRKNKRVSKARSSSRVAPSGHRKRSVRKNIRPVS